MFNLMQKFILLVGIFGCSASWANTSCSTSVPSQLQRNIDQLEQQLASWDRIPIISRGIAQLQTSYTTKLDSAYNNGKTAQAK